MAIIKIFAYLIVREFIHFLNCALLFVLLFSKLLFLIVNITMGFLTFFLFSFSYEFNCLYLLFPDV